MSAPSPAMSASVAPSAAVARSRWRRLSLFPYLMLAPTLTLLAAFTLWPLAQGLWTSLFRQGLVVAPKVKATWPVFVGIANYRTLLVDPDFQTALLKTVLFTIVAVPLLVGVSLALAMLLKRSFVGVTLVRAIVYFPSMVSLLIIGIVWKWLLAYNSGLLNFALELMGLPKVPWLEQDTLAQLSLILVWVWANAGFYMVIFISGLAAIPTDCYEAAALDGARPWAIFTRITLPLLKPTFAVVIVLSSIEAFKVYELVVSLTGGGPGRATAYVIQTIYETAFTKPASAGIAAAQSAILFLILMVLSLTQLRLSRERRRT